jgi:uncharacterized protein (TIGR02266 family)
MNQWTMPTTEEAAQMRAAVDAETVYRDKIEADLRRRERIGLMADVSGFSETNFFSGLTENLSEGGVFVATLSPPETGETVHLKVTVNGDASRSVVVMGIVRWHRTDEDGSPTGCGIQFANLSPDAVRAISILMETADREPLFWDV